MVKRRSNPQAFIFQELKFLEQPVWILMPEVPFSSKEIIKQTVLLYGTEHGMLYGTPEGCLRYANEIFFSEAEAIFAWLNLK